MTLPYPPSYFSNCLLSIAGQGNPAHFLFVLELAIDTHLALVANKDQDQYRRLKGQLCVALLLPESIIGTHQTQQLAAIALDLLGRTMLFRINHPWSSPRPLLSDYTMSRFRLPEAQMRQLLFFVPGAGATPICVTEPSSSLSSSPPFASAWDNPTGVPNSHPYPLFPSTQDLYSSLCSPQPTIALPYPGLATTLPTPSSPANVSQVAQSGHHQPQPLPPTPFQSAVSTVINSGSSIPSPAPLTFHHHAHHQDHSNGQQQIFPSFHSRSLSPPPPTPGAPLVGRRPRPPQPPLPPMQRPSTTTTAAAVPVSIVFRP